MVQLCTASWACSAARQEEEKLQEVACDMWASSTFPQSTGLFSRPAITGGLVRPWDTSAALGYPSATQQVDNAGPDAMIVAVGLS